MEDRNFDLLLVNGRIVTETGELLGSLGVRDGIIAHLGPEPPGAEARERIDCEGKWILPGGVDAHVHVGISFGDTETSEGWAECSRAALAGGTTTIVDFAIPKAGEDPIEAFRHRLADAAEHCVSDYSLHGCYTERHLDAIDRIDELIGLGTRTIKVYTTYKDKLMASDATIERVMSALREADGMIHVHAEDDDFVTGRLEELKSRGPVPFDRITEVRPVEAENIATRRIIDLALKVGTACYFVHQASPEAIEAVGEARGSGGRFYSEVCPHYLVLDDSQYAHGHGCRFTCCPPLRPAEVRDELMRQVLDGRVDVIASDHCAFQDQHKVPNAGDLEQMPFGMPGVQTRVPVMLSELHAKRGMAMTRVADYLSTRPAKLNGLYPQKGVIAVGSDADVVIWDERGSRAVAVQDLVQASDYSPFDGFEVAGSIAEVYLRGTPTVAARDGDPPATGRFVPQGAIRHAEA